MVNIQIRDVPEDIHGALVERATARGQSLQCYLSMELARLVSRPTAAEIFQRIEARGLNSRFSPEDAVRVIRAHRDGLG